MTRRASTQRDPLEIIPGVGPSLAGDLQRLGYRAVADLEGQDPEALYERLIALEGKPVDRCVLYVFRCAIYYASSPVHDPEKLKWWHWKDTVQHEGRHQGEP